MEITTTLWRERLFLKRKFWRVTFSQMVSPLLYFVTLGIGLGGVVNVDGQSYLYYLIPGLLAMTTMCNSYISASMRISVMRLHEKSFKYYFYSPTRVYLLAIGHTLAGASGGMHLGVFILLLGLISRVGLVYNGWLLVAVVLNAWTFSALGLPAATMIRSHYDVNNFTNAVITPISFLYGAFFSLEGIPQVPKQLVNAMPLTHTTQLIWELSFGNSVNWTLMVVSTLSVVVLTGCCVWICYREAKQLRFRSDLGRSIDTVPPFSYSNLRAC